MKTCVYLSYVGLGANLLHLSYCHQIASKFGPITIITLCENLKLALKDDPLIREVIVVKKYQKKLVELFKLSNFLKEFSFDKIFIFYPSPRIFLAAKLAKIKEVYSYNFLSKRNLHLVKAAKNFTEKYLKINNCPTETNFFISEKSKKEIKKNLNNDKYNIIIGAGSSGPTTKWGSKNYVNLINKLNKSGNYFFYILCGPNEQDISDEIINNVEKKNCFSLSKKNIQEVIPYLCSANLYVGNDSFGHHITSQTGIPSIILILDTPKAYSDYSVNQYRITPKGIDITDVEHDDKFHKDLIEVSEVYNKILYLKKN